MRDPDQRDRLARLGLDPDRQRAYTEWKHKTLLWNLKRVGLTEADISLTTHCGRQDRA